jgi:hypothetical protein
VLGDQAIGGYEPELGVDRWVMSCCYGVDMRLFCQ